MSGEVDYASEWPTLGQSGLNASAKSWAPPSDLNASAKSWAPSSEPSSKPSNEPSNKPSKESSEKKSPKTSKKKNKDVLEAPKTKEKKTSKKKPDDNRENDDGNISKNSNSDDLKKKIVELQHEALDLARENINQCKMIDEMKRLLSEKKDSEKKDIDDTFNDTEDYISQVIELKELIYETIFWKDYEKLERSYDIIHSLSTLEESMEYFDENDGLIKYILEDIYIYIRLLNFLNILKIKDLKWLRSQTFIFNQNNEKIFKIFDFLINIILEITLIQFQIQNKNNVDIIEQFKSIMYKDGRIIRSNVKSEVFGNNVHISTFLKEQYEKEPLIKVVVRHIGIKV